MTAVALPTPAAAAAHRDFDAALGRIDAAIRHHFRRWPRDRREDAAAEARAATWAAWHGLIRRGLDPAAVGISGIAANACRSVKAGRTVASKRACGQGARDLLLAKALRRAGLGIDSLEALAGPTPGTWQDWLAAGRRSDPAEQAAFRVDFEAWLASLSTRRRRVAALLAEGRTTGEVARRLGVTPAAISQARVVLALSWRHFQGEPAGPCRSGQGGTAGVPRRWRPPPARDDLDRFESPEEAPSMGARQKLNVAHIQGGLLVGAVFGALTRSAVVFVLTSALLIGLALHGGEIRPGRRGR